MDLSPLISRLWSMGKRTYLPGLHGQELWFLPYTRYTPLCRNRFGIPEPDAPPRSRCLRQALDLVLMPLVAFDESGNRLGMGGGYYDRTFAYLLNRRRWRRPMLLGVAYEFQCVESLPTRHWDVPLDGVVTDKRVRLFSQRLEADD